MSGSGYRIGMMKTITKTTLKIIPKVRQTAMPMCSVVAHGILARDIYAQRTATGNTLASEAAAAGFGV